MSGSGVGSSFHGQALVVIPYASIVIRVFSFSIQPLRILVDGDIRIDIGLDLCDALLPGQEEYILRPSGV